jgi:hypothetical protein
MIFSTLRKSPPVAGGDPGGRLAAKGETRNRNREELPAARHCTTEGNHFVMTLVELEGNWINTDQVCVVRPADQDGSGFQTEIVMAAGLQKLKMPVAEAAKALRAAK